MKRLHTLILAISCLTAPLGRADLVAHWPLDTDASDATGNGHDGTVIGGTVNFGQVGATASTGTSAQFPDSGHIDVPFDTAINPGSFTVALWANAASTDGFASPLTSRDDVGGGVSTHGYILYNNSGGFWDFWTGDGDPGWDGLPGSAVALDSWTHIAITYDAASDTKTLWIDGEISATDNVPQSGPTQYSPNGTVEMENLHIGSGGDAGDEFFFNGLIDDVGVWDEALSQTVIQSIIDNGIASGLPDPALSAPNPVELVLNGAVQNFDIPISNSGQTQTLTVSAATFNGDPNFSVVTLPGPIAPGGTDNLQISFDPLGGNGAFQADLEITSNDELTPVRTITLNGLIHDPMIVTDNLVDLGSSPSGTLTISNDGASRVLNISNIQLTGDTDEISLAAAPPSIPAGSNAVLGVTFDPDGQEGSFSAIATIETDDPINPSIEVQITASVPISDPLVAWWPLDVDSTDATGHGFDGIDAGAITYGQPGANAATATSAVFSGAEHIDVPWDPALNTEDFTVTLWANAAAAGGGSFRSPITNRDDVAPGGTNRHGWIIYNNNNGFWSFWNGGGTAGDGGWNVANASAVTTGTWSHIAITYDSATNTKNFYLDGTAISTTNPVAFSPNDSTRDDGLGHTHEDEDLHIGGGGDAGTSFRWEGGIDDVGLFRVALSQEQIADIMENGISGFTGSGQPFRMLNLVFGPGDGEITVTFTSTAGAVYAIERASDMTANGTTPGSWEELTDDYDSQGETTSFTDTTVPAGATRLYYRARRL